MIDTLTVLAGLGVVAVAAYLCIRFGGWDR